MADKRLHWIDVAKGMLILLVVLGHFSGISKSLGIDHAGVKDIGGLNFLFTSYYMAAFFVLTGYTTNFNKRFLPFFMGAFKSLVIPAFVFAILYSALLSLLFKDWSYIKDLTGVVFWYSGFRFFWFLNALFLARLCYWLLYNYVGSDIAKGLFLLILMVWGIYYSANYKDLSDGPNHNNPFYVQHFMRMAFFLWIGQMYRKYEIRFGMKQLCVGGGNFCLSDNHIQVLWNSDTYSKLYD